MCYQTLYWLPEKLPKGVLCVLSTDDADQESVKVLQTDRGFRVLKLAPLKEAAQHEICVVSETGRVSSPTLSTAGNDGQ